MTEKFLSGLKKNKQQTHCKLMTKAIVVDPLKNTRIVKIGGKSFKQ